MTPHSSVLAWRIQGTGEPGGLPSMGLHRVRHDWSDLAAAAALPKQIAMGNFPDMKNLTLCMEGDYLAKLVKKDSFLNTSFKNFQELKA